MLEDQVIPRIDRGIPIPTPRTRHSWINKLILEMKHGDSVVLDHRAGKAFVRAVSRHRKDCSSQTRTLSATQVRVWLVDNAKAG